MVVMELDTTDETLLWVLTHRLRLLSVAQVARTWWPTVQQRSVEARLRGLVKAEMIRIESFMAHPELPLPGPVFSWHPGDVEPAWGPIAYRLQSRWPKPLVATPLVFATPQCTRMFGGYTGGRGPRPSEATHDLHLGQVYLVLRQREPKTEKRWVSENELYAEGRGRNERLPDAIIRGPRAGAPPTRVIEFGGAYKKSKLEEFHREMARFRYEVW